MDLSSDQDFDDEPSGQVGVLGELVGYRLRRAYGAFHNDFARALAGTGMRQVLFAILAVVGAEPGTNQGEIGRRLGIKRANMVSLVNELLDRRLILRRKADGDRRAFALSLTAEGRAMLEASHARILAHEQKMLSPLSPEEQMVLLDLLTRVAR